MLKLSRPLHILLAALIYTLGASMPAYLGFPINAPAFWLGFTAVLFAQWSMALLSEVFRPHNEPLVENAKPAEKETLRNNMLYISIAALTVFAVLVFLIYLNQPFNLSSFLFLLSSFLITLAYSIPPLRLLNRGFGELALAAHIAYIVPSIGFFLQARENHRMLIIVLLPLIALALAYFLIINFSTFGDDQKYQRATLLRNLTWQRAVPLHHSLIIFAFMAFSSAPLFGFSISLIAPAFLSLPFAILQIILIHHIAQGGKPNWNLITVTALALFALTAYFLLTSFWIN